MPIICRRVSIGHVGIHRIAILQSKERAAGLSGRIQVAVKSANPGRLNAFAVFAF